MEQVQVSIHAPHGGRDAAVEGILGAGGVSIHAPHGGRDVSVIALGRSATGFQSTRPTGGATDERREALSARLFQSTRPTGGATGVTPSLRNSSMFQSTRPTGGATGDGSTD